MKWTNRAQANLGLVQDGVILQEELEEEATSGAQAKQFTVIESRRGRQRTDGRVIHQLGVLEWQNVRNQHRSKKIPGLKSSNKARPYSGSRIGPKAEMKFPATSDSRLSPTWFALRHKRCNSF